MKIRAGESIFIDFIYSDGEIPVGYGARFIVRGEAFEVSGELERQSDRFLLRIPSAMTAQLAGEYRLLVYVENPAIGFLQYIYDEPLEVE